MGELEVMGYSLQWRINVLRSSVVGYIRVLAKVATGETSRNRKGSETLLSRRFKKLLGSTEWYRATNEADAEGIMPPWEKGGITSTHRSQGPHKTIYG